MLEYIPGPPSYRVGRLPTSCVLVRSRDKLDTLYLHLEKTYGQIGTLVTYCKKLPPIKSFEPLIT